ncbi:ribulose-phosphate 3-epimerase [Candidatus Micrarchaeota archaeon]|nr:ribulose-phosphate 3-epimerase [Candidatus Micrarchaeota archaeon]
MNLEVMPAILVKDRTTLIHRINLTMPHVNSMHIDLMDGEFVPNKTIQPKDLHDLPHTNYVLHWMFQHPEDYIPSLELDAIHLLHIEAVTRKVFDELLQSKKRIGLAINPKTPLSSLDPYLNDVNYFLVMSVTPGFDGQKYLPNVEDKISQLRKMRPNTNIEVDGGINADTGFRAARAGANVLAAASFIFSNPDVSVPITELKGALRRGWKNV